jgi:hypothetical protein
MINPKVHRITASPQAANSRPFYFDRQSNANFIEQNGHCKRQIRVLISEPDFEYNPVRIVGTGPTKQVGRLAGTMCGLDHAF